MIFFLFSITLFPALTNIPQAPDSDLPQRPGTSDAANYGKAVQIRVNQFKIKSWGNKDIWLYDVQCGGDDTKPGKARMLWETNAVQNHLKRLGVGRWIFDGQKLAW